MDLLNQLESVTDEGLVNVVVDTPSGSAVKFKYDVKQQCYRVSRFLPAGASFPFNFGSIPRTAAADGDALDILVLSEAPLFVGCLVSVKLIGVLKAQQKEGRKTIRNDRLLGAPATSVNPPAFDHIDQIGSGRIDEIEHFFVSYNLAQRRAFTTIGRGGPREAQRLLRIAQRGYAQGKS